MKIAAVIPNYNHSAYAYKCIDALLCQRLDAETHFNIILVDDGSTDGSADAIHQRYGERIKLLRLTENRGRSTARNIGAESSDADYILFIDSDCIATDDCFVQAIVDEMNIGADIVFGQVSTRSQNFWDFLQKSTFKNRHDEFKSGQYWAYTTQNVCIKKDVFLESGGFDLIFDKYGFEDRDLFIRLIRHGAKPAYCHAANVIHYDKISLASVSIKMLAAGRNASTPFREKHPKEYGFLPYSKLDCALHPWLSLIDRLTWPIVSRFRGPDPIWLEFSAIPLSARITVVRLIYGLHYLHGTRLPDHQGTSKPSS